MLQSWKIFYQIHREWRNPCCSCSHFRWIFHEVRLRMFWNRENVVFSKTSGHYFHWKERKRSVRHFWKLATNFSCQRRRENYVKGYNNQNQNGFVKYHSPQSNWHCWRSLHWQLNITFNLWYNGSYPGRKSSRSTSKKHLTV